jgi:hypothetical protein
MSNVLVFGQSHDNIPISTKKNKNAGSVSCVAFIKNNEGNNVFITADDNRGRAVDVSQKTSAELVVRVRIDKITDRTLKGGILKFYASSGTAHLATGKVSDNNSKEVRLTYSIMPDNVIREGILILMCEVRVNTADGRKSNPIEIKIPYKINPPLPKKQETEADKLYEATKNLNRAVKSRIDNSLMFINKYKSDSRKMEVETQLRDLYDTAYLNAENDCDKLQQFVKEHDKSERYGGYITKAKNRRQKLACDEIAKTKPQIISPLDTIAPKSKKGLSQKVIEKDWKTAENQDTEEGYQTFINNHKTEENAADYLVKARKQLNEIVGKDEQAKVQLSNDLTKVETAIDSCDAYHRYLETTPKRYHTRKREEAQKGIEKYCKGEAFITLKTTQESEIEITIYNDKVKNANDFEIEVFEKRGSAFRKVPEINYHKSIKEQQQPFKILLEHLEGGIHRIDVRFDNNGIVLMDGIVPVIPFTNDGIVEKGGGEEEEHKHLHIRGGNHPLQLKWVGENGNQGMIDLSTIGEPGQRIFELYDLSLEAGNYKLTAYGDNILLGNAINVMVEREEKSWLIWAILGGIIFIIGMIIFVFGKDIENKMADYAIMRTVFGLTKKRAKSKVKLENYPTKKTEITLIEISGIDKKTTQKKSRIVIRKINPDNDDIETRH